MKKKQQISNSREELISMILGLGVVILVVIVIINFVIRSKGNISVPGISTTREQIVALTTPGNLNNANVNVYEVKKGDSLWSIAVLKYNDGYAWTKIASENKLQNASIIEVGQKLVLPNLTIVNLEKTENEVSVTTTADTYTVQKNDSLWKIAVSQLGDGYKWTQVWNLNKNKIVDSNQLEVGMILRLR